MTGAGGADTDLKGQRVAGRPVLLWLFGEVPDADTLQQFAGARDMAMDLQSQVYLVVRTAPQGLQDNGILVDPDDGLAARLGLEVGGLVVVDPSGRIAGFPGTLEAGLELCRGLFDALPVVEATQQAPVLLVPEVLDAPLCQRLIAYWDANEKTEDRIASAGQGHQQSNTQLKRRTDVIVTEPELFAALKGRLGRRLVPEVRKAFQVHITNLEAVRIGCYEGITGGFFGRHRDNTTEYTAHRQFAVSLNLNDGYDGGQVQFAEYGRTLYRPPAGGAVVFSCSLLHEVFPVTAGRRFALFTFLFDAAGAERERELQKKLIAEGYEGTKAQP